MGTVARLARAVLRELNFGKVRQVMISAPRIGTAFADHRALVTGGSSGIGLEIAKALAMEGCSVIIAGTKKEKLQAAKSSINSDKVQWMVMDVSAPSKEIDCKVGEAASLLNGCPDIVVNAAGVLCGVPFEQLSEVDWDRVMDTNLRGSYFVSISAARRMVDQGVRGHILLLSSSSALRPGWGPYEISKWGVKGMTLGLADRYVRHGITVNALGPGPTNTPMLGKGEDDDLTHPTNPSGRYASPRELAELALVLLGPTGEMIVGDTLYATGGSGTISLDR